MPHKCPSWCHKCPDMEGYIMPGCVGGAVYSDLDHCTCDRPVVKLKDALEKKLFRAETLCRRLEAMISDLSAKLPKGPIT